MCVPPLVRAQRQRGFQRLGTNQLASSVNVGLVLIQTYLCPLLVLIPSMVHSSGRVLDRPQPVVYNEGRDSFDHSQSASYVRCSSLKASPHAGCLDSGTK